MSKQIVIVIAFAAVAHFCCGTVAAQSLKNRAVFCTWMLLSLTLCLSSGTYASPQDGPPISIYPAYARTVENPTVVMYDAYNFQGSSRSFGIGQYRLFNEQDFNDLASSIRVPKGVGIIVYEHADEGGGFGEWVDFLEDQPDLSKYKFDNKISYLEIFATRNGSEFYERNKVEDGRFAEHRWIQTNEDPNNSDPVVAPIPKDPNIPLITSFEAERTLIRQGESTTLQWQTKYADRVVIGERYPGLPGAGSSSINWQGAVDPSGSLRKNPAQPTVYVLRAEKGNQSRSKSVFVNVGRALPTFCSIDGRIIGDRMSYGTTVELRRTDTSQPVRTVRAIAGTFKFERVPVGNYQIVPKAHFPPVNERPSSLWFFPRAGSVTCRPNVPHSLVFRIDSTE